MAARSKVQPKAREPKAFTHKSGNKPDIVIPANDTHQPQVALALTAVGDNLTMSSLEIAEVTGKRHQDVLRDIRNMLEPLGQTFAQFCAKVPSAGGRPMTVANLPKRESLILVSGYNVELRAKIIDRWAELEAERLLPVVNLPPAVQELIRRTDGISRMLAHKVTTTENMVAQMQEALVQTRTDFLNALLENDPRAVAIGFKPSLEVLKDHDVPTKGRRGFSQKVSSRLLKFSIARKQPIRESHETGRRLFHVDAIAGWLEIEGTTLIRNHKAKLAGDGELFRLVKS